MFTLETSSSERFLDGARHGAARRGSAWRGRRGIALFCSLPPRREAAHLWSLEFRTGGQEVFEDGQEEG